MYVLCALLLCSPPPILAGTVEKLRACTFTYERMRFSSNGMATVHDPFGEHMDAMTLVMAGPPSGAAPGQPMPAVGHFKNPVSE